MDAAAVVSELVDEVRIQEGEARRQAAGVALLGEAFAQASALSFATIRALRTYTAELEGVVQSLAPGHLAVRMGSWRMVRRLQMEPVDNVHHRLVQLDQQ